MRHLILLVLLIFSVAEISAQAFFVSESGLDENPGTQALPFRSIQKALGTVKNGVIYVREGTYREKLNWQFSGTADSPITLAAYLNEKVIVDGVNFVGNAPLLQILSKSHVLVQGITFRNNIQPFAQGIYIAGTGDNVHINNCVIENIGWTTNAQLHPTRADHNANGILVLGNKDLPYRNVSISYTIIRRCQTGRSEALTITGNVDRFRIENNWVHDITNIGIDVAGHYAWTLAPDSLNQARNGIIKNNHVFGCVFPDNAVATAGIYADGARDIIIERNHCYNNSVGISVGCENDYKTSARITVRNNFIYHNLDAGVFWGANAKNSTVEEGYLYNNTFFRNATSPGWKGELELQNSTRLQVFQNIFSTRLNKKAMILLQGFTLEQPRIWSNLYFNENRTAEDLGFDWGAKGYFSSLTRFQQATGHDANALFADPLFVSDINMDLHLQAGSPSRDRSDNAYRPAEDELDIDGQPRLMGISTDFGADELSSTTKVQVSSSESFAVFPNPAHDHLFFHELPNAVLDMVIVDASGRIVETCKWMPGQREIQLDKLLPGMYYLKIVTRNQLIVCAFVKV